MLGNSQIPLTKGENLGTQLKRLVPEIMRQYPLIDIYVLGLMPRGDHELELTPVVRAANEQLLRACKDLRRFKGWQVSFISIQKIFLERVKFKDPKTGKKCEQTRLLRPLDKYFREGLRYLNEVGIAYLRSYIMDQMGIRSMLYPWTGIPKRVLDGKVLAREGEEKQEISSESKDQKEQEKEKGSESQESDYEDSDDTESGSDDSEQSLQASVKIKGKVRLGRRSEFGGESATKRLKRTLDISPERLKVQVEEKKVKGLIRSWEARVASSAGIGCKTQENTPEAEETDSSEHSEEEVSK